MPAKRFAAVACLLLLTASACGRSGPATDDARRVISSPVPDEEPPEGSEADDDAEPTPPSRSNATIRVDPPTPGPGSPKLADARVTLTQVASLNQPLAMAVLDGDDALYVAEKGGRIRAIRGGQVDPLHVLDISGEVSSGSEQGLLGLAFSPDRQFLYVNFTNRQGDTVVREYRFSGGRADTSTARNVLTFNQPFGNHNGGDLHFGPDRRLYISTGDGGSSGDPQDNGQSLNTLLGKLLRVDPRPSGSQAYGIPSDNPFVGRSGARGEIWAYGLRNPWRVSFDSANGDLYLADVGQNQVEEVNWQPTSSSGGENYGWNRLEGSRPFRGSPPAEHVLPIYEYDRTDGNCSITGGFVYRGERIPALTGAYLFADHCKGELRAFVQDGGRATDHRLLGPKATQVSAFGQDHGGELYVISLAGAVYRIDPG